MSQPVNHLVSGAPAGAPTDVTTPALRSVSIKYHTLPGDRLLRQTRLDLVSAGVPESALGTLAGRTLSLSACIELTDAALGTLPPALGGVSVEDYAPYKG
jgi:hypothetical protein